MTVTNARKRLLTIWLTGSALPFLLLVVQTITDRYAGHSQEAWSWFLPCVMPTLGLMIAVTIKPGRTVKEIEAIVVTLASVLSVAYLLLVLATLVLQPFSSLSPFVLMKLSQFWLAPIQALVAGTIGSVFARSS